MAVLGTDFSSSYLSTLTTQASNLRSSQEAGDVEQLVSGLSSGSTKEELTEAAKTFEAYFVEQVLKQIKESTEALKGDDDSDSYSQQVNDLFMDQTIQTLASEMVDEYGGSFTEQMVENMMAQYGITDTENTDTAGR